MIFSKPAMGSNGVVYPDQAQIASIHNKFQLLSALSYLSLYC